MLWNFPFAPGRVYPFSEAQIGSLRLDAGAIQVSHQIHTDQIFTSGYGGGTKLDIKGYTVKGKLNAFIARSGNAPHQVSTNLPGLFQIVRFKIWTGGFYAEGDGLITSRDADSQGGKLSTLDLSFDSDGAWDVWPNVVELY